MNASSLLTQSFLRAVLAVGLANVVHAQTNTLPLSGNVGIGTTSPTFPLQLQMPTTGMAFMLSGGGAGRPRMQIYGLDADANAWMGFGTDMGGGPYEHSIYFPAAGPGKLTIGDFDGATYHARMMVTAGGNVGVGTSGPSYHLQVQKTDVAPAVMIGGGYAGSPRIQTYGLDADANAWMGLGTDMGGGPYESSLYFPAAGPGKLTIGDYNGATYNTRVIVTAGGNVGVGTTDSTAIGQQKLFVAKDVTYPNDVTSSQLSVGGASDPRKELAIGYDTNGNGFGFLAAGFRGVTWTSLVLQPTGGNVGIGTTNPGSYKLAVNGTIHTKEVVVDTNNWSDYVFNESYKLKALSEVEAYVKTEKHLPGIPSAQEVAEHGVSMGEMQSKLLAKIEELTLHQIAQEKRLNAQAERIEHLETENATLRQQR